MEEGITLKLSREKVNNLMTFLNRATLQGSEVPIFAGLMRDIQMQIQIQSMPKAPVQPVKPKLKVKKENGKRKVSP